MAILSIVIPTSNRRDNLKETLFCIKEQDLENKSLVRVIIVDDNSNDGTQEMLMNDYVNFPYELIYVKTPSRSTWNASIPRNMGAKLTEKHSEYIMFLDSDILMPPDRIRRILEIYSQDNDPNRVLIGQYHFMRHNIFPSKDHTWYEKPIQDYEGDIRSKSFEEHEYAEKNTGIGYALACFGGLLVIPRKLFFKSGGYDENVTSGMEDGEFGLTLAESGAVFSLDSGLLSWHNPHPITMSRTVDIPKMIKYIDEKHQMELVKETGSFMRKNGINWRPPKEWLEEGGYSVEELYDVDTKSVQTPPLPHSPTTPPASKSEKNSEIDQSRGVPVKE